MNWSDENPFEDLMYEGRVRGAEENLRALVSSELGVESLDSVFVENQAVEEGQRSERAMRFDTITEAVLYLFDAGILHIGGVDWDEEGSARGEVDNDTDYYLR